MKYVVLAALISIGSLSSSAQDGDISMGTDSTGSHYWLIRNAVRADGQTVFAWIRTDNSKDATVTYRTSKFRLKIDCVNERLGQTSTVRYAPNGSVMNSRSNDYPQMEPAIPGSMGAYIMGYVCPRFSGK